MRIVIAILIFSIIVIFHELGHMLVAKKNGIKVVEFSIGLGPTIIGKQIGETKYSIKLLPFGGACQMLGEQEDLGEEEGSFNSKTVWQRMAVIFAGPFFNFIMAFVFAVVITAVTGYDSPYVTGVAKNSPAELAGIREGDIITSFGGTHIDVSRELDSYELYNTLDDSTPIVVKYKRDGKKYETSLVPKEVVKYLLGFTYNANETPAEVQSVSVGYPMETAGVKPGDIITAVDGVKVATGIELSAYMNEHPLTDREVSLTYKRDGVETIVSLVPRYSATTFSTGFTYNMYREKTNFIGVMKYSVVEVKFWVVSVVKNLGLLFTGQLSKDDLGGPVAIVEIIGDSYTETKETGSALMVWMQMFYIIVLLSANLGVMNLLPIPALDGGRLLFLIIEAIRRKPVDREKEGIVNLVGIVLLMILMVFVFFNDIMRIINR